MNIDSDSPANRRRRKVLFSTVGVATLASIPPLMGQIAGTNNILRSLGYDLLVATQLGMVAALMIKRTVSDLLVEVYSVVFAVAMLILDWNALSQSSISPWTICILLLDIQLLLEVTKRRSQFLIISLLIGWNALIASEKSIRWGLFDAEGTPSLYDRQKKLNCENPPCQIGIADAIGTMVAVVGVILLDYYFTKGFKDQALDEKQKLVNALNLSKLIVTQLLAFNLERAAALLESNVENELHEVLTQMIENLELYKPYLPDSLFSSALEDSSGRCLVDNTDDFKQPISRNPPGLDRSGVQTGELITILFTDIVSSTTLWELHPEAMSRGLRMHNTLIRSLIDMFDGYEVKTIGDSFMIAFDTLSDACSFGLELQSRMSDTEWPWQISGISLRVSAHAGEARIEQNEVTGRCDYFGPVTNKASRMESVGVEGTVTVTQLQLTSIEEKIKFLQRPLGKISLRGFAVAEELIAIFPTEHEHKKDVHLEAIAMKHGTKHLDGRTNSSRSTIQSYAGKFTSVNVKYGKHSNITVARIDVFVDNNNSGGGGGGGGVNSSFAGIRHVRDVCGRVANAVERTNGNIITICCTWAYVSWNITKHCPAHLENAFECCSLLVATQGMSRTGSTAVFHAGVATGGVFSGDVGSSTQKFISIFGPCMRLSELLSDSAREFQTPMLHAACPSHFYSASNDPALKQLIRPIDSWRVADSGQRIQIFEGNCKSADTDELEEDWGWSESYWSAYDAGKWETLNKKLKSTDVVGLRVAHLLSSKTSLRDGILLE